MNHFSVPCLTVFLCFWTMALYKRHKFFDLFVFIWQLSLFSYFVCVRDAFLSLPSASVSDAVVRPDSFPWNNHSFLEALPESPIRPGHAGNFIPHFSFSFPRIINIFLLLISNCFSIPCSFSTSGTVLFHHSRWDSRVILCINTPRGEKKKKCFMCWVIVNVSWHFCPCSLVHSFDLRVSGTKSQHLEF
jgi:hypothetical protein